MSDIMWPCAVSGKEVVYAAHAARDGEYTCPDCSSPVTLVRGKIKRPHFRHQSEVDCHGEGARHFFAKHTLAGWLWLRGWPDSQGQRRGVYVEKMVGNIRPDVLHTYDQDYTTYYEAYEVVDRNPYDEKKALAWEGLTQEGLTQEGLTHTHCYDMFPITITNLSDEQVFDHSFLHAFFEDSLNTEIFHAAYHTKVRDTWCVGIARIEWPMREPLKGDYAVVKAKSGRISVVRLGKEISKNQWRIAFEKGEETILHWREE
jgi:hypothetical protein